MKRALAVVGIMVLVLSLCGCDDNDGGGKSGPAEGVDLTGTWDGRSSDGISFVATIVQQSNGSLGGTVRRQEGHIGSISGHVKGTEFYMHVIWNYGGTGDYSGDIIGNAIEGYATENTGAYWWRGTFTAFRQ